MWTGPFGLFTPGKKNGPKTEDERQGSGLMFSNKKYRSRRVNAGQSSGMLSPNMRQAMRESQKEAVRQAECERRQLDLTLVEKAEVDRCGQTTVKDFGASVEDEASSKTGADMDRMVELDVDTGATGHGWAGHGEKVGS